MRRRLILRVALPAIAALAILVPTGTTAAAAAIPIVYRDCVRSDSASHACNTRLSSLTYYKGWASTAGRCPGGQPDDSIYLPVTSWRWTGSAWQYVPLNSSGARVYIWPYAVDWSWAWTQDTGWVAVRDSSIEINRWCPIVP